MASLSMFARRLLPSSRALATPLVCTTRLFSTGSGRLQDRTAIVTGGGSGIGQAACEVFAKEGARVLVVDLDKGAAERAAETIRSNGGEARALRADVTSVEDTKNMIDEAEKWGNFRILFNNAGISHAKDEDAINTTEDVWDMTMNVNVRGVFLGCKYAIPALRRSGGGSIINTASFVACLGAATPQLAYTASKGAVLAMSRELAVLHARENIRVNALCPGPLNTELLQKYLDTEEKRQRRLVHIPMGRFGESEEIANAALFLASEESSFVTGSTFLVDGGITAAYVTPE